MIICGVIYEDVDAPEFFSGLSHRGTDQLLVSQISDDPLRADAQLSRLLRGVFQHLGVARNTHNVSPVASESDGECASNAPTRPGD